MGFDNAEVREREGPLISGLTETNGSGALNSDYIFFGGKRIARRDSSGSLEYYFADRLGSHDVVTNSSGTVVKESDFYPYGGEIAISGSEFGTAAATSNKSTGPSAKLIRLHEPTQRTGVVARVEVIQSAFRIPFFASELVVVCISSSVGAPAFAPNVYQIINIKHSFHSRYLLTPLSV